jgi:hypothetical protein
MRRSPSGRHWYIDLPRNIILGATKVPDGHHEPPDRQRHLRGVGDMHGLRPGVHSQCLVLCNARMRLFHLRDIAIGCTLLAPHL